jgi:hypothetical protein
MLVLVIGSAEAQSRPAPALTPEPDMEAPQSSTEQGQSPLGESFEADDDRRDRIGERRRQAFEDTAFDVQARSFLLDRDQYDGTESFAVALGGSAGLKTGYFRDRFAIGLTGYTSQPLDAPDDKDGTQLLAPGQEGFSVLGEAFVQVRLMDGININAGRKGFDTPYISRNDTRMAPNTFEAISLQGVAGDRETGEWRMGAGYFDKIKSRNSDQFVSMAEAAGAPAGVERGVYTAGANYRTGPLSFGVVDYYSDDIVNIFYAEARYLIRLADKREFRLAAQYSDQRAVGKNLLQGADFSADQLGLKTEFGAGPMLLTAAYTMTGDGAGMQSPWSGYPGYTSVQVEDFNRAGEDAWMLRAGFEFPRVPGLSVYGLWVSGSNADSPTDFARDEYDLNLQWTPETGALKGLMVRLRYAHVEQDDGRELDDFRLMIFYDPPKL